MAEMLAAGSVVWILFMLVLAVTPIWIAIGIWRLGTAVQNLRGASAATASPGTAPQATMQSAEPRYVPVRRPMTPATNLQIYVLVLGLLAMLLGGVLFVLSN